MTFSPRGVSCTNHSPANTKKAYEQGLSLFDLEDPDYEACVTRSERDRATANCVLAYAAQHHPRLILVECTTELYSWGQLVPGKRKVGDGSTYRWWLKQFDLLGYNHKVLYLNSMFFGVGQSRDRGYWVFWDKKLPTPDLDHRPESWCDHCQRVVEAVWSWKTGVPPTGVGSVRKAVQLPVPPLVLSRGDPAVHTLARRARLVEPGHSHRGHEGQGDPGQEDRRALPRTLGEGDYGAG